MRKLALFLLALAYGWTLGAAPRQIIVSVGPMGSGGLSTGYLGYSDPTGSTQSTSFGTPGRRTLAIKVTVPNSGTLVSVRGYLADLNNTTSQVVYGIWNDNAGSMGALKATTAQTTDTIASGSPAWTARYELTAAGGQDLLVTASQVIWIGVQAENDNSDYYYFTVTSGDAETQSSGTFNTLADGPGTDTTRGFVLEAEYTY